MVRYGLCAAAKHEPTHAVTSQHPHGAVSQDHLDTKALHMLEQKAGAGFVSLGEMPQDKKYRGEPTRLEIGEGNTIREFCTLNCGTVQDVAVGSA